MTSNAIRARGPTAGPAVVELEVDAARLEFKSCATRLGACLVAIAGAVADMSVRFEMARGSAMLIVGSWALNDRR